MAAPGNPYQADLPPKKSPNTILWVILGVAGVGCCGFIAVFAAILFPVFSSAKNAAQTTACMSNTKQLAIGITMYSIDFDDRAPLAANWLDAAGAYTKSDLCCPVVRKTDKSAIGYAYNKALASQNLRTLKDPSQVPMVFDSTELGRNAASGLETLPSPGRHRRSSGTGNNIARADASAKFVPDAR